MVSGLITARILTSLNALLASLVSSPSSLDIPETYIMKGSRFTFTLEASSSTFSLDRMREVVGSQVIFQAVLRDRDSEVRNR